MVAEKLTALNAGPLPGMPEIGHPEMYYARGAHDAQKKGDCHLHEAYKVGQYVTLALNSKIEWDEKLRYFKHATEKHCVSPIKLPDDPTWGFYMDLKMLVRDYAGDEAMRLASLEDDRYAAMEAMGKSREQIEDMAEVFFKMLIPCDVCPDWFHDDDYRQLKVIRDQWI